MNDNGVPLVDGASRPPAVAAPKAVLRDRPSRWGSALQPARDFFARLLGPGDSAVSLTTARLPPDTRVYAVGDLHGRLDLLTAAHDRIRADVVSAPPGTMPYIVYLGDYVDRGADSRGVLDALIGAPLPGFRSVHLMGNHDQQFLKFLDDPTDGGGWLKHGGAATVYSYGVRVDEDLPGPQKMREIHSRLVERVPGAHRAFLAGLQTSFEIGDFLFVHAGVDPRRPLDRQRSDDLLWMRDPFLDWEDALARVVVHGHTVTAKPDVRTHRIGIDTGAVYTNRLACLVLDGDTKRFLFVQRS